MKLRLIILLYHWEMAIGYVSLMRKSANENKVENDVKQRGASPVPSLLSYKFTLTYVQPEEMKGIQ